MAVAFPCTNGPVTVVDVTIEYAVELNGTAVMVGYPDAAVFVAITWASALR